MKKIPILLHGKIIYINYEITKNKNMYMKVTKENTILISAPIGIKKKEIILFAHKHIKKFIDYIENDSNVLLFSLSKKFLYYNGKKYKLIYLTGFLKPSIKIMNNCFYLMTSLGEVPENEILIKTFLKEKIQKYVTKKQAYFEKKMHIPNHKIKVVYKTSTWGTNNGKTRSISYSSKLAHFSNQIKDYLIVHELVHYFEPNHSLDFWNIVEKYAPNYKNCQKELKFKSKILENDDF